MDSYLHKSGKVIKMLISPVDKSLIIFLGTHGVNWICSDCGNSGFKAFNNGKKMLRKCELIIFTGSWKLCRTVLKT